MKGGREAWPGCDGGLNQQSGLKCTGHAPSLRGSGYRRVYGETTKHASEASVLTVTLSMAGWSGGEMLPEPAWLYDLGWWVRAHASDIGSVLLGRYSAQSGVKHAT